MSWAATIAATLCIGTTAMAADVEVGRITSLSGPGSSIGIPCAKGMQAALADKSEVGGHKAVPGTPAYRTALRDALTRTKEVVGTHGVYDFKPDSRYGQDEHARLIVKLDQGKWTLAQQAGLSRQRRKAP